MPGRGRWSSSPATLSDTPPGPGAGQPRGGTRGVGESPAHLRPAYLALVFAGGSAGTLARYLLSEALPTPGGLPAGIFTINIAGAFALGLLLEALLRRGPDHGRRRVVRLVLGTGFLGGFTTYSALTVDSALLLQEGRFLAGAGYLLLTVLVGLAATIAGILLGGRAARSRAAS